MAQHTTEDLQHALDSYGERATLLKFPTGTGELGGQKNSGEATRDKIVHIEALDRSVIGSVTRVCYGQYNGRPACLVCMRFTFRYRRNSALRFKRAEIVARFDKRDCKNNTSPANDPTIQAYAPRKIFGEPTMVVRELGFHVGADLGLTAVMSGGPQASIEKRATFAERQCLEIVGLDQCTRRRPKPHIVVWTVAEVPALQSGIPDELYFAAVVAHDGAFQAEIKVKVDTPLKDGLYAHVWSKDAPVLFIPSVGKGEACPRIEFDALSDDDWRALVAYPPSERVGWYLSMPSEYIIDSA